MPAIFIGLGNRLTAERLRGALSRLLRVAKELLAPTRPCLLLAFLEVIATNDEKLDWCVM